MPGISPGMTAEGVAKLKIKAPSPLNRTVVEHVRARQRSGLREQRKRPLPRYPGRDRLPALRLRQKPFYGGNDLRRTPQRALDIAFQIKLLR